MPGPVNAYLMREHELILEILDLLRREAARLRAGGALNPERLARFLLFFRLYADTVHHHKEEDILFEEMYRIAHFEEGPNCMHYKALELERPPVLLQLGEICRKMGKDESALREEWKAKTREGHIVNPLLQEHILGRSLVQWIEHEAQKREAGLSPNNSALCEALYRYEVLLREHIDKENNCLSHTVDRYFPLDRQEDIVRRFQEMDEGPCRPWIEEALAALRELRAG